MTERRNIRKIRGLLFTLVMLMGMLGRLPFTVSAAEAAPDLTVTIDTGASVTLKDTDSDGYYEIGTADELAAFAELVNGGQTTINAKLQNDIVVNENLLKRFTIDEKVGTAKLKPGATEPVFWTPIGGSSNQKEFAGIFDGQGHAVSGLYFEGTSFDDCHKKIGLIGILASDGVVKNVEVKDSWIKGTNHVGGVVGNSNGTIENCKNTSYVVVYNLYAGGITGYNHGTVTNCQNNGSVLRYSYGTYLGGIVGGNYGTIVYCRNEGTVLDGKISNPSYVGGIAGEQSGDNDYSIIGCCNTGVVTGNKNVGGIVGYLEWGKLEGCYNTGNVTAKATEEPYVGGVVGAKTGFSNVAYCCYLDSSATGDTYATAMTEEQFISGEAAFYLNGKNSDPVDKEYFWYQTLGTEDYPVLVTSEENSDKAVVYRYETCLYTDEVPDYAYSNEAKADGSHLFEAGSSKCLTCEGTCGVDWVHEGFEDGDTCTICNITCDHSELGYSQDGENADNHIACCKACNWKWSEAHSLGKDGTAADCTSPAVCGTCELKYGTALGHEYYYEKTETTADNKIEIKCSRSECTDNLGEIELLPPENLVYDGTPKLASIQWPEDFTGLATQPEISYTPEETVDAGTYTASITVGDYTAECTFTIEKAPLELVGIALYDCYKEYDGTTKVSLSITNLTFDGKVGEDDVSLDFSAAEVNTASANVGEYETVTVSNVTLMGEDAANYSLPEVSTVTCTEYKLSVSERTLYITVLDQEVALNGSLNQGAWELDERYPLLEGHRISSITLVGDTDAVANYATVDVQEGSVVVLDAADNEVTENYTISTYSGNLKVKGCDSCTSFDNGFCKECGNYEAAIQVTEENCEELGLTYEHVSYYAIGNAGQLFWFAEYINHETNDASAVLLADITVPEGKNWIPIGNSPNRIFFGAMDGNYKTISGLNCNGLPYAGLIGWTWAFEYKNIFITDSSFQGTNYSGALACYTDNATVTNCGISDTVTVIGASAYTGGLIGSAFGGSITNCYSLAQVSNSEGGEYYGGLVGYSTAGMANCFYLADSSDHEDDYDGTTAKTEAQFASGELAYLLQSNQTADEEGNIPQIWGQNVDNTASVKQSYPTFDGAKVYQIPVYLCHVTDDTVASGTVTEDDKSTNHAYSNAEDRYEIESHTDADGNGYCDSEKCKMIINGKAALYGRTLVLGGDIGVVFYFELTESMQEDTTRVDFILSNGKTASMNYGDSEMRTYEEDGKTYYGFMCKVHATEMDQLITASIYDGNTLLSTHEYSVQQYCTNKKADLDSTDANDSVTLEMINALETYGAMSQNYFDEGSTESATAPTALTDTEKTELAGYGRTITASDKAGISSYGMSLVLFSETSIRAYFTLEEGKTMDDYSFKVTEGVNGTDITEARCSFGTKSGHPYLEIAGIGATNLDTTYVITVSDSTGDVLSIQYSAFTYINNKLSSEDAKTINLITALYRYNRAAESYAGESKY